MPDNTPLASSKIVQNLDLSWCLARRALDTDVMSTSRITHARALRESLDTLDKLSITLGEREMKDDLPISVRDLVNAESNFRDIVSYKDLFLKKK
jgi:hypothetical protein